MKLYWIFSRKRYNRVYAFAVMHNHPSGSHFSRKDIKTFVDAENMTILIVIGNNGDIYILEKTRQLSINELLSVRKSLIGKTIVSILKML